MCVCVCVCACARVRVCVCVCACVIDVFIQAADFNIRYCSSQIVALCGLESDHKSKQLSGY